MLGFFRKYQKFVYIIITFVIVVSFSFFGTYGALQEDPYQDSVAFTAADGSSIYRSEVERMAQFISTNSNDVENFYGNWGPNFLNDGVIEKDFLQTGMASILAKKYMDVIRPDMEGRYTRENRYQPYHHPNNRAISAEEVWKRYNPSILTNLEILKNSEDPLSPKAFEARINLYLANQEFSGNNLKRTLMYIEQMNGQWMQPDPNLPHADLSLFGYRTADDWFGQNFIRTISEFIINSSIIAESKGYKIPREEVLADLIQNAQTSFANNKNRTQLGVHNATQYLQEQLRRMHMDQTQAIKTWRQVMLFRRMFHDVGNAVVTDPLAYQEFYTFAKDSVEGDQYLLPPELQLGSFNDLQLFQTYIKSVAPKNDDPIALPQKFLAIKDAPDELVQQRFTTEYSEINKDQLSTRVGIREMWAWQVQDENWKKLEKEFPELSEGKSRQAILDDLNEVIRSRVDAFSRKEIAETHPEWITDALAAAPKQQREIAIRLKGGSNPLPGVVDRKAFIDFLNKTDQPTTYTPDNKIYYLISVIKKPESSEILTFGEAKKEGVLQELLDQDLEKYYSRIRDSSPEEYQMPDGTWKELQYVREDIAKRYFSRVLDALQKIAGLETITPDIAASYRFIPYMKQIKESIEKDPSAETQYVKTDNTLENQWKITKAPFTLDRSNDNAALLNAPINSWTPIENFPNGAISFRHVTGKGNQQDNKAIAQGVTQLHQLLSNSAQQEYMLKILKE